MKALLNVKLSSELDDKLQFLSIENVGYVIQKYSENLINKIKEEEKENMLEITQNPNGGWSYTYTACVTREHVINSPEIQDFNIIVPGHVVEVHFEDGGKEKMICHKDDKFDLRNCLFIAIAKHIFKDTYTFEGLEKKAKDISYEKKYVKIVDKALKDYNKKLKEIERNERIIAENNAIAARKREKRIRKAQNRRERYIEAQKEAYKRALAEVEMETAMSYYE